MRILGLLLALGILLGGCSWTMSRDRQQRISDCLSRCEAAQGPAAPAAGSYNDPGHNLRDQRSQCERECHQR